MIRNVYTASDYFLLTFFTEGLDLGEVLVVFLTGTLDLDDDLVSFLLVRFTLSSRLRDDFKIFSASSLEISFLLGLALSFIK